MTNAAYEPERIQREDVQTLLRKVDIEEDKELTERFETGEMSAVIDVAVENGTSYRVEKTNFTGHPQNP